MDALRKRRDELENDSVREDFWQDNRLAKEILKELESIKIQIRSYETLQRSVGDAEVLL